MNHPIMPPAYKPTEEEHQRAYLKWCLDHIVGEELFHLWMARRGEFDKFPAGGRYPNGGEDIRAEAESRFNRLLDTLFPEKEPEGTSEWEPWDRIWWVEKQGKKGYEGFKLSYEEDLASEHCGDCTSVPCACSRCWAEGLYGIPFTATWTGKHEGWKLLNEYRALQKNKGSETT